MMVKILDFNITHIKEAEKIALMNYNEEKLSIPDLPQINRVPDLKLFAENALGVAAFENGRLTGFLCCVKPFKRAFHSTDAIGVFSPMGANGVIGENRAKTFALMYQAAGEKWIRAGAASHAVCLYAHDRNVQKQFFKYGFGMRCVDAISGMGDIEAVPFSGCDFMELPACDFSQLFSLNQLLIEQLGKSPSFMKYNPLTEDAFEQKNLYEKPRYFIAKRNEEIVAYLKIADEGENFVCNVSDMTNICGAYCVLEYRGKGVFQNLLRYAICKLKTEGYTRLGVDFESINPTAWGFWLKYFSAYTYSLVRRIDEHAVNDLL